MTDKKPIKKPRIRKAPISVRQRMEEAEKLKSMPIKKRRLKMGGVSSRLSVYKEPIKHFAKQEFYLPIPEGRLGNFLNKKRSFPSYFSDSFKELKMVTWPSRKETFRLTSAVFIFAVVFGGVVAFVDHYIEMVVKKIILK